MSYGAYIYTNSGNPFITPESTPFALYARRSFTSGSNGSQASVDAYIPVPSSYPTMTFCRTSETANPTATNSFQITSGPNAGTVNVRGTNVNNQAFTLVVYVFAIFPQTLPSWGMAIWNAQGTLVLTNETKVLTDLITVPNSGLSINQTYQGSYAVSSQSLGFTLDVNTQTLPPRQGTITYTGSARFNGSRTWITPGAIGQFVGGTQSTTDFKTRIVAINTAEYD